MSIDQAIANLQGVKRNLKKVVGNEMTNYALDNIKRQRDANGMPLRRRKPGTPRDARRLILVDTGEGRRTIAAVPTATGVELQAAEHMVAHNQGATIRGNFRVRAHTRRRKGRSEQVTAHSRQVNITLPQRQFFGKSAALTGRINERISKQIINALT
jgi:hypothetical protein